MKNILFAASALFLALSTATADASQSFVAFGLTNVTLGQAIFSSGAGIPVVTNLSTNGVDGLSVLLGEADSGAFLYVNTAAYPEDGDYMIGKASGNLGGLDEQLICTVQARRMDGGTGFGVYPVAVDFTPLGATNLLFQVFAGKRLVAQA